MDKKKEIIKAINYAKYLAFILATICVMVFQFTANPICVTFALALYVVAFGLMFASLVVHCTEIYAIDRAVKEQKAVIADVSSKDGMTIAPEGELKGQEVEVVNLKKEKVWSVIGATFFAIFTLFTFIVLILY